MKLKDLIPEDVAAKNIPSDVKMLKKGKDGNKQSRGKQENRGKN